MRNVRSSYSPHICGCIFLDIAYPRPKAERVAFLASGGPPRLLAEPILEQRGMFRKRAGAGSLRAMPANRNNTGMKLSSPLQPGEVALVNGQGFVSRRIMRTAPIHA